MIKKLIFLLLLILGFANCAEKNNGATDSNSNTMYFPPINGSDIWENQSISSLGWNQNAVQPLLNYLLLKNTKSFIILINGRIVIENYYNGHTATSLWKWNSAGKTLTSTVTGIAEQEGFINTDNNQIIFNELNTIPGFTPVSMYPMMWQASGLAYPDLLTKLIDLAVARQQRKNQLKRNFNYRWGQESN